MPNVALNKTVNSYSTFQIWISIRYFQINYSQTYQMIQSETKSATFIYLLNAYAADRIEKLCVRIVSSKNEKWRVIIAYSKNNSISEFFSLNFCKVLLWVL